MASGNTIAIFFPTDNEPPDKNYATIDIRGGHPCLDYDASVNESGIFTSILPRYYSGGGITSYIHFAMSSATNGNIVWHGEFERIGNQQQTLDSNGFANPNSGVFAAPSSGNVQIGSIVFTDGTQIDSIAVGEMYRFRLSRNAANASDTAAGDAEFVGLELKET